jgi:hypothetical protein
LKYILSFEQSITLLDYLINSEAVEIVTEPNKHRVIIQIEPNSAVFKLPWCLPLLPATEDLKNYRDKPHSECPLNLIVLIQAGYASLGITSTGTFREHKVIQKYMVRKKQGKAQITYLNKKGKSRAGSRIRLAQTVEFFEEINERINHWTGQYDVNRILISCTERLWGMLYQSKIKPPFQKKDQRILRIPVNVHRPTFAELRRINYLSQQGEVSYSDACNPVFLNQFSADWKTE